jgi:hypothetical protein
MHKPHCDSITATGAVGGARGEITYGTTAFTFANRKAFALVC